MIRISSLAILLLLGVTGLAAAADHAVVFTYHRFGEDRVPATNIRLEQFDAHLQHLEEGGFTVWPLSRIVAAIRSGEVLPERTVALTADDAYRSVMTEAWPRLQRLGWTMTLFVGTDGVDQGFRGYLTWDEIRRLRSEGMEIGGHSAAHGHMAEMTAEDVAADLARANRRFVAEMGEQPKLLAWPYGEYRNAMAEIAGAAGYVAAFGQHSGAIGREGDIWNLPRFAMNEAYGKPERFRMAASSRPMPISALSPADTLLPAGPFPAFGFEIGEPVRPSTVACYHSSGGGAAELDLTGRRIAFTPSGAAGPGRSRYNCTAPAPGGGWYWHGRQFVTPGGTD